MATLLGGIEAGGTKFVCAVGDAPNSILLEERFPTSDPESTLQRSLDFFLKAQEKFGPLSSLGIGSFGPIDLDQSSPTYGSITSTPKLRWAGAQVVQAFKGLGVPIAFDTDTNAAALGELFYGKGRGLDTLLYITVGTGVGGGIVVNKKPIHGLVHPEIGHIPIIPRKDDSFPGLCPFHGTCLEGMAAGPAIQARWGVPATDLLPDHEAWDLEAEYIAQGLWSFILTVSPQKIILGGGVMHQPQLFPLIRGHLRRLLAGYVDRAEILEDNEDYISFPELGNHAGITGALVMAEQILLETSVGQKKS
jgi:fructokinase